jgi:hypothetical protein
MKRILKYAGICIGVIVLLAVIAPFLIPAETYKKIAIKQAESRLNGKLEVGSMRIKILPLPGFTLKNVKLTGKGGQFPNEPVVLAGEISASVSLVPLFSKAVVASLKLVNPEVYYRTAKNGRTNIDDLLAKPKTVELRKDSASGADIISSAPSAWKALVKGLEIKDGSILMSKEGEAPQEINHLDIKLSETSLYVAAAVLGGNKQNIKADGKFNIDLEKSVLNTKELKLTIGEALFLLSADAGFKDKAHVDANLELANANVGQLLAFDPKIAAAVTKDLSKDIYKVPVALSFGVNYDNDIVSIKKAVLAFGGTKINANGTVSAIGKMSADLSINISPVKLSELKKLTQALAPAEGVADPDLNLKVSGPLAEPQKVNISGHVETKKIKYMDYEISNLKADFAYGKSLASLSSLSGNLYGGTLSGNGLVRLLGEPAYEASVNVSNVDMSKIPATKDILKGTGTLKVNASGKGTDSAAVKKNLKASGNIFLANGDIPSLKLGEKIFGNSAWQILANAGVGLNKEALNELKGLDASCKNFSTSFSVENGVITTPDVKWQHSKYRVGLSGSVSMDESLNYEGEFALSKPTTSVLIENQTAKAVLTNKSGELAVPFDVKGTASALKVSPDEKYLTSLFGKAVKEIALKEVRQKVIGPAIKETGKKLLEGIFGK